MPEYVVYGKVILRGSWIVEADNEEDATNEIPGEMVDIGETLDWEVQDVELNE